MQIAPALLTSLKEAFLTGGDLQTLCEENSLDYNSVLRKARLECWSSTPPVDNNLYLTIPPEAIPEEDRPRHYLKTMGEIVLQTLPDLKALPSEKILALSKELERINNIAKTTFQLEKTSPQTNVNVNILAQGIENFIAKPVET